VIFDLVFCVASLAIFHGCCQYKSAASRMLPA
jgi:hypothetical protein